MAHTGINNAIAFLLLIVKVYWKFNLLSRAESMIFHLSISSCYTQGNTPDGVCL